MKLPKSLLLALRDCANYAPHRPYIWKPKSMEKLERLGFVKPEGLMYEGKVAYVVTDLGRAELAQHPSANGEPR